MWVGSALCPTWPAGDARSVIATLPTYAAACGANVGECSTTLPLTVVNSDATIACPPFCAGAVSPVPLPVPFAEPDGTVVFVPSDALARASDGAGDSRDGGGGVTYLNSDCVARGFTDPSSGA